ncbi:hypothetical protein FE257_005932 [Aspergillus nanangensis]|uniref:ABM domain-containing protein n=1 Tax=Aspergillus nanangensis TaxID=2582783 RepID=A0AAD4CQC5_ASPNN|nr:hypothetical protein FE257_005932 [Aspergillus nanangensis]
MLSEVYIISTLRSAPGKGHQLREVLRETTARIDIVEKGCLAFMLTETKASCGHDVIEFKVIERWASSEDLAHHQQRDWLKQMYRIFEEKSLLAEPEHIEKLTFLAGFASR